MSVTLNFNSLNFYFINGRLTLRKQVIHSIIPWRLEVGIKSFNDGLIWFKIEWLVFLIYVEEFHGLNCSLDDEKIPCVIVS